MSDMLVTLAALQVCTRMRHCYGSILHAATLNTSTSVSHMEAEVGWTTVRCYTRRNVLMSTFDFTASNCSILPCRALLYRFQILKMDIPAWHEMYTDLPSKQLKVPVTNKSIVHCSEDETSVTSPPALQEELNRLMGEIPLGRCFVRPSGTEDVMRVYAEGSTQEDADRLAMRAVEAINKFVG